MINNTSHTQQPQLSFDGVSARMHGWVTPAAVATIAVAKLFTTKINRCWKPGGLLREEDL
ncbi:MAG TPA: hypothetical protein VEB21_04500 [Terriglobales bacterium]|nr:hypothetical protein [Terriglobales bacterium]